MIEISPAGGVPVTGATSYTVPWWTVAIPPASDYRILIQYYSAAGVLVSQDTSNATFAVRVKPSVGKPSAPSRVKTNKKFQVTGSIVPGQGVGPAVRIQVFKRNSRGTYVISKTYRSTVSGTNYSATLRLGKTGQYKVKAVTTTTQQFVSSASVYSRVITVRR